MSLIDDLKRRVGNMLFRAVITRLDEGGLMQALQVAGRAEEVRDRVHHLLPYGLSSAVPTDGSAETVVLSIDRGNLVALPAAVRSARVRGMAPGDVALNTRLDDPAAAARGATHRLHLFEDGGLRTAVLSCDVFEVRCGDTLLRVDASGVTIDGAIAAAGGIASAGDVGVTGTLAVDGDITATGSNPNHHTH